VLAAGAGSRFGGAKLLARFDGKPVLQHVLDALAGAGFEDPIVVLAPGAHLPGIDWLRAERITNLDPARGLASSLHLGWERAVTSDPAPDAVLVALGDQPLVRAAVIRDVAAVPLDGRLPILAARYSGTGAHNPVRVEITSGELIAEAAGDRGLGPVLERHPELVRWIDVDGDNPDVDTSVDLSRVAELAWASRVSRNREQVERFRELPDGRDFYASVSSIFRDDPHRTGDPVLDALRAHARPADTWLDIGAGAGRYALPLARTIRRVIALDPSTSMLAALGEGMAEHEIGNVEVIEGRWPAVVAENEALARELPADLALIAHVSYDVEEIGSFLDAMERAARRECVAVLMERNPAVLAEPFWPPIHGEHRIALPALPAFVDLLRARGRTPTVDMVESSRRRWASRDEVEAYVRRQTWVAPGTAKDRKLQELLDRWVSATPDGRVEISVAEPLRSGLVAWSPG
jgi:CTP:molybdopterin cytidylyltransferase MocA/ubiquinone/menaquinone biosynthesis C-methylase UbiE